MGQNPVGINEKFPEINQVRAQQHSVLVRRAAYSLRKFDEFYVLSPHLHRSCSFASMSNAAENQIDIEPVTSQPATVEDKRLVQRILAHWQEWCLGDEFPRRADIAGDVFGDDWQDCFILDSTSEHPFPVFDFMGQRLAKFSGVFLSGKSDWTETLLDKATGHVDEVFESRDVVLIEEILTRFDGKRLAFRCILLPLSEDGETITHILGAANGKLLDPAG